MILIVGGAFQGKKEFAAKQMHLEMKAFADGINCELNAIYEAKGMVHFHEYIRRMLLEHKDTAHLIETLMQKNPDIVLVGNELGYGVVPIDAFDRNYRETTGRVCTQAAAEAKEVYRVVCGIGTRIK